LCTKPQLNLTPKTLYSIQSVYFCNYNDAYNSECIGLSFQDQFVKLDYLEKQELGAELQQELQQELQKRTLYSEVLKCLMSKPHSRKEISTALGQKKVSGQLNKIIQKLFSDRLIKHTIPDTPNHPAQKFQLTERGNMFLKLLEH
jgi:ATP-dependent DNA helicase RecG